MFMKYMIQLKLKFLFSLLLIFILSSCSILKHKISTNINTFTNVNTQDTSKTSNYSSGSNLTINDTKIITVIQHDTIVKIDSLYFKETITQTITTEGKQITNHDTIFIEKTEKGIKTNSIIKEKSKTTLVDVKKSTKDFTIIIICIIAIILVALFIWLKRKFII